MKINLQASEFCCQSSGFDIPISETTSTTKSANIFADNSQTNLKPTTKSPEDIKNSEYEFIFDTELGISF